MIFADKLIQLRKKQGWSQDELAEKMNVSRQSVSKWECAQSIPDLDKILQLSKLFGVSTDYLLKEELEETEYTQDSGSDAEIDGKPVRRVSMEEASEYIKVKESTAKPIAYATFLCIISPITLMILSVAAEFSKYNISENTAAGIGLIVLFMLIATATVFFIRCGAKTSSFEYLEKEIFETEYGVEGMVRERQKKYKDTYTKYNIIGTCLCILSVVPLFVGILLAEDNDMLMICMVSLLLLLVGIGTIFFVIGGINWEATEKLLQEGDYTREKKTEGMTVTKAIKSVYWLVVVAIFLGYNFATKSNWGDSWIIWPVAGVLFAVVCVICSAFEKK